MLIKHNDTSPEIDPSAWVAPNAVVCGNVKVGPGCRIMYGAQVIAESGTISIGSECIIMENTVLRSSVRHPLNIGSNCLIGPNAHIVGCSIGSEVRTNAVVHLKGSGGSDGTGFCDLSSGAIAID